MAAAGEAHPQDADAALQTTAGWVIVTAWRNGLLTPILDLHELLDPDCEMALEQGTPRVLPGELPRPKTIGDFVEERRRQERHTRGSGHISLKTAVGLGLGTLPAMLDHVSDSEPDNNAGANTLAHKIQSFIKELEDVDASHQAEIASAMGDAAACRVVEYAWDFLAPPHRDDLDGAAAKVFFQQATAKKLRRNSKKIDTSWMGLQFLGE